MSGGRAETDLPTGFGRGSIFAFGEAKRCIIHMISGTEACLAVYSPDSLPATFRLFVEETRSEVDCVITWRGRKEVGVRLSQLASETKDGSDSDRQAAFAGRQSA
jgi:hypothetical protein